MNKLILSFMLMGFSAAAVASVSNVVMIDMQRAVQSTTAGKKAKSTLETEFNKKKAELQKKEGELKKMGEELEKKAAVLSEDARRKKQTEMQQEMMKFRQQVQESQTDIQKREREITKPILDKMADILQNLGKEEKYTMILEKGENNVIWVAKEADITDKVVARFEKEYKK